MLTSDTFDTTEEHLIIPAMGSFYDRLVQPLAWVAFRLAVGGMLVIEGWRKIMAPLAQTAFVESLGFYPGCVHLTVRAACRTRV